MSFGLYCVIYRKQSPYLFASRYSDSCLVGFLYIPLCGSYHSIMFDGFISSRTDRGTVISWDMRFVRFAFWSISFSSYDWFWWSFSLSFLILFNWYIMVFHYFILFLKFSEIPKIKLNYGFFFQYIIILFFNWLFERIMISILNSLEFNFAITFILGKKMISKKSWIFEIWIYHRLLLVVLIISKLYNIGMNKSYAKLSISNLFNFFFIQLWHINKDYGRVLFFVMELN